MIQDSYENYSGMRLSKANMIMVPLLVLGTLTVIALSIPRNYDMPAGLQQITMAKGEPFVEPTGFPANTTCDFWFTCTRYVNLKDDRKFRVGSWFELKPEGIAYMRIQSGRSGPSFDCLAWKDNPGSWYVRQVPVSPESPKFLETLLFIKACGLSLHCTMSYFNVPQGVELGTWIHCNDFQDSSVGSPWEECFEPDYKLYPILEDYCKES